MSTKAEELQDQLDYVTDWLAELLVERGEQAQPLTCTNAESSKTTLVVRLAETARLPARRGP